MQAKSGAARPPCLYVCAPCFMKTCRRMLCGDLDSLKRHRCMLASDRQKSECTSHTPMQLGQMKVAVGLGLRHSAPLTHFRDMGVLWLLVVAVKFMCKERWKGTHHGASMTKKRPRRSG